MKKRIGDPFMAADDYGRSLSGFNVNLLVPEVAPSVRFLVEVLEVELVYEDPDLAILRHEGHEWMVHADHTYDDAPMLRHTRHSPLRGRGCELRLYNIDPDAAETRARARGYEVLAASADKPHGLRECYIVDPAGYVWVPGRGLPAESDES